MPWPHINSRSQVNLRGRFLSPLSLVSFVVAGAFLLFLVTRLDIDLGATWESFKDSNLLLFVLAVAVHYTTFIFRGARWRLLLMNAEDGPKTSAPGTWYCGALILLGWFANSVTWFRLGDAYRGYTYAGDRGGSFPRTMGTILAERVLDMGLVLLLLLSATLILLATGAGTSWVYVGLAALMAAFLGGVLLAMGLFRSRLARLIPGPLEAAYVRFHEGTLGSFRRRQLLLVTVLGLLGWLAEIGRLYLVAEALGFPLGAPLVIFITLANAMLTLVPITPGGLGAVEWGLTGLLMLSDRIETETTAFSIVALDRSISWLSVIAVGALVFLGHEVVRRRRQRALAAQEALTQSDDSVAL